MIVHKLKLS